MVARMKRLNPEKLHVTYLAGVASRIPCHRALHLTHSDFTGELFLSIGRVYDAKRFRTGTRG